jgi:hypothetical protein
MILPYRQRSSPEGKSFGRAIVATGVAATAYHSAKGGLRVALRKLDHWTISLTAAAMARAVFPNPSRWRRAIGVASLGLAPFQPFAVSALNFGLTEVMTHLPMVVTPSLTVLYASYKAVKQSAMQPSKGATRIKR